MTKYDFFRRRVAPVLFVLVLGLLAYDQCNKHERTHATFVLEYGAFEREVRVVEAEVWMNGERVTSFRREATPGAYIGRTKFDTSLPDTTGELRIDVDLASGDRKHIVRKLHVREGETMTFGLEPDLR